ncbi:MAG: putative aldouronate transport system substrate-binding protein, partial [Streptomyces sp.]|nr:putative aldouronate transport system substrate-binding protein [Streptomyces sp.]
MPNSQASANGSAPSRRMFLSGAVAVAATAAGGSLLSACSTPNSTSGNGGVATGSSLQKLLPAYVASDAVKPDIAGVNGSTPGFLKYPANLVTSVSGTPGKGGSYKAMTPAWWSIPNSGNAYFKAVNKALGTNIKIQESDGNTYQDKIGAILASSDIPDWMTLPTWNLT